MDGGGGESVVAVEWAWLGVVSQGFEVVQRGDKYGFVNSNGVLVLDTVYDDAGSFNNLGVARVQIGKQEFFIDSQGRRV